MSPWWREEVSVNLAPCEAVLVRRSRGPRRRELAREELAAGTWRDLVALVGASLASHGRPNANLRVTLRGSFVRYLVLPWVAKLSDCDVLAYARQSFSDVHGEAAHGWSVCVNEAVNGSARIAAAADRELIEALQTLAGQRHLHLQSVEPSLCAAVHDLARADERFSGWLALIDAGHSCVARFDAGTCVALRTARFTEPAGEHLLGQLEQDALCAGIDAGAGSVFLYAAAPLDPAPLHARGWRASPLMAMAA